MDAHSQSAESPPVAATANGKHLVVLVHGINTRGYWTSELKSALEEAGFIAEPCGYGVYGVTRFLLPIQYLRDKAIERVRVRVNLAIKIHQPTKVSVVAHSFGSYIIARLMAKEFQQDWHRIIFCGSVNDQAFAFEQYLDRFTPPILNDIGSRDLFPALAEKVTWGYGAIGSYGAQSAALSDRWHSGFGHSDFLNEEFCTRFWVPFLHEGTILKGDAPQRLPWWARLLLRLPLRWILAVLLLALATLLIGFVHKVVAGAPLPYSGRYRTSPVTADAPLAYLGTSVLSMADDMRAHCALGWFDRRWLGQSCVPVDVGGQVASLRSCKDFDFAVDKPEDAVRQAAATFDCLTVTERFGTMSISVRSDTPRLKDATGVWLLCGCSAQHLKSLGAIP